MSRNISIKEALGMATKTLVSNKLRSSLTMLGIIIGNASVITLVGLGRGAQTLAKNQLSNLGANVLFIVPGNNDTLENIDNHQIINGDLITLQLNEGVIYMGQIEDDDSIDKYKYV